MVIGKTVVKWIRIIIMIIVVVADISVLKELGVILDPANKMIYKVNFLKSSKFY